VYEGIDHPSHFKKEGTPPLQFLQTFLVLYTVNFSLCLYNYIFKDIENNFDMVSFLEYQKNNKDYIESTVDEILTILKNAKETGKFKDFDIIMSKVKADGIINVFRVFDPIDEERLGFPLRDAAVAVEMIRDDSLKNSINARKTAEEFERDFKKTESKFDEYKGQILFANTMYTEFKIKWVQTKAYSEY